MISEIPAPKISGFSLIRNGILFDYPFEESIRSALPLVDEFVINVGKGTDATLEKIDKLRAEPGGEKIKIFESTWPLDDPEKKKGGLILSEQTNLALEKCQYDWCLYLQADEVLHEADLPNIRQALIENNSSESVDGLLFDYLHFYGSFDVIQESRSSYRREVRVIRKSSGARSIGDAQSFRKKDATKLSVRLCNARIFHYGWVRPPEAMKQKTYFMDQLYHGDPTLKNSVNETPYTGDNYRYKKFWGLRPFVGTHPNVMALRIQNKGWHWDLKSSPWVWSIRDTKKVVLDLIEKFTGIRLFEYRSYILLKNFKKNGGAAK
ncbi:MAG: glycosyltransferase family 2 protein [Bdellovibrio sp.]|nr:glycosyltransferase family 2 protein [Bdellovibrio sp.]